MAFRGAVAEKFSAEVDEEGGFFGNAVWRLLRRSRYGHMHSDGGKAWGAMMTRKLFY